MNNAEIILEDINQFAREFAPIYRERADELTNIIEALQNIAGSSYWKVLKQFVFDVDLDKAKRRLVAEKDTTEIFRLQGEIRWGDKFDLEKLLDQYKKELIGIRNKI